MTEAHGGERTPPTRPQDTREAQRGAESPVRAIAVDFDGVIHAYGKGWHDGSIYDEPVPGALAALHELMRDYAVFVHTTRSRRQVARWIEQRTGYAIECVTSPWPSQRSRKFWTTQNCVLVTNKKLPAVAYIDDRAIRFESWPQALSAVRGSVSGGGNATK